MRRLWLLLVVACGQNNASSMDMGVGDMSETPDLKGADLIGLDFTVPPPPDLAGFDIAGLDLAGLDFAQPVDLRPPPDLTLTPADAASMVGMTNKAGCGAVTCDAPQYCCAKPSGNMCRTDDGVQCTFSGGTPVFCDSAGSTCTMGDICCLINGAAQCVSSCSTGTQVCSPTASGECTTGSCQPYTGTKLPAGYYTCQ